MIQPFALRDAVVFVNLDDQYVAILDPAIHVKVVAEVCAGDRLI